LGEKHAASAQPVDIYLDGQDESGEDDIAAALEVPHSHSSSSSTSGEANGDAVDDFAGQILPPNFPVLDGDKDGLSIPEEHLSLPVPDEGSKNANDGTASSSEMGENKSFWEWMKEKVKGIIGWG
jgi:hypothetical protein